MQLFENSNISFQATHLALALWRSLKPGKYLAHCTRARERDAYACERGAFIMIAKSIMEQFISDGQGHPNRHACLSAKHQNTVSDSCMIEEKLIINSSKQYRISRLLGMNELEQLYIYRVPSHACQLDKHGVDRRTYLNQYGNYTIIV